MRGCSHHHADDDTRLYDMDHFPAELSVTQQLHKGARIGGLVQGGMIQECTATTREEPYRSLKDVKWFVVFLFLIAR